MEKTVLVTGAHGFVGRHTVRLCAQEGYTVKGIGHGDWPEEEWKACGLSSWHSTDITAQSLLQHAEKPDIILHCAGSGSVGFSTVFPLQDFERTVLTTAHVLEYMRVHSPDSRLVYPSSASVYGIAETLPIPETAAVSPISPYGSHKLMVEQLIKSFCRQFQIAGSIVRFFSLYGKGLRKQLLWDACARFEAPNPTFMGSGNEIRDWLHVEDAAALLLVASDFACAACPIVNGGSGQGVAVRDILIRLGHQFPGINGSLTFSGTARTGDPPHLVAGMEGAARWQWKPSRCWQDGVDEYARWWHSERMRS